MAIRIFQQQRLSGHLVLERRSSSPQRGIVCRTASQLSEQVVVRGRNTNQLSALIAQEAADRPIAHEPRQGFELAPCRCRVSKRNTQHLRPAETGNTVVSVSVRPFVDQE